MNELSVEEKIYQAMGNEDYLGVAYDGCHKIYIIENHKQKLEAEDIGYEIYPIGELNDLWEASCELRFINYWDLNKPALVVQFEDQDY